MQRQPRTPQEAASLDPLGLLSMPLGPNQPRGLFGAMGRRRPMMPSYMNDPSAQQVQPAASPDMAPPPITSAPPPPSDWKNTLGPDLMASLPRLANGNAMQPMPLSPSPPMRGGRLGDTLSHRGIFGSVPSAGMSEQPAPTLGASIMSDKANNRGAPPMPAANGNGKKGFDWRMLAGIVGDGLLGLNGQPGVYGPAMWKRRQDEANHAQRLAEMREQNRLKLAEPDYATVNNRRVRIDPTTGESEVLYTAPQDFEDYAVSLGAEPGTPEFDRMVQDYVLRGSGPTATDNYNTREEWRQDNRLELEGERQGNRQSLLGQRQAGQRALKGVPTYRQANPVPPRAGGRSGGSRGVPDGTTATGPGGAKMIRRGGQWVKLK